MLPLVQLQTSKLTLLVVGYAAIVKPPVVAGTYPVTAFIDPFGFHVIASVDAVPVAVVVTTVAHAAVAIELVPREDVPLAMVCPRVTLAGIVVPFTLVELESAAGICAAVAEPLRLLNVGCALEMIPEAEIAVRKLLVAPVSGTTALLTVLLLLSLKLGIWLVESNQKHPNPVLQLVAVVGAARSGACPRMNGVAFPFTLKSLPLVPS